MEELGNLRKTRVEKIFLAKMTKLGADFLRDLQMVVDHERNSGGLGDGQNDFRHATDFVRRRIFGAKLNEVRAASAKLLRDESHVTPVQVRGIDERVEATFSKLFHQKRLMN